MITLFPEALIHDPHQGLISKEKADVAFVCVPTPLKDGKLDSSIVEQVVKDSQEDLIIIRSTIMPGTCESLELKFNKNIVYQPEYLGESVNHSMSDQKARTFMILGGRPMNRRKAIELYQTTYNANINIRQVTHYEAEVIKLSENRAISFKVVQCQELYDACEKAGVDYYTIREAVYGDDPRFNLWWTFIYPNKRGAKSKCLPKDVYGWAAWAESVGVDPEITKAILKKNAKWIR
jgi:UDPglucose 6-dehydrogenase